MCDWQMRGSKHSEQDESTVCLIKKKKKGSMAACKQPHFYKRYNAAKCFFKIRRQTPELSHKLAI